MPPIKQINPTTYEVELLGKDKVEIGDRESKDFKPHIKLNRWGGECFIKVGLPIKGKRDPVIEGNKVKWIEPNLEAHLYPLEAKGQNELDGFEFEIILKKKPKTNQIVLNIETRGLRFFYQPALTQQEIDSGAVRPDNVVGSYAVYHATKGGMVDSRGKNYKAGKAFHIYRPRIEDADGKWVWGELQYTGTQLITTIPQDFLDSAKYPIRHAAGDTFGYTDAGVSFRALDDIRGYLFTGAAGTASKLTAYLEFFNPPGSTNVKAAIYLHSDSSLVEGSGDSSIASDGAAWKDFTVTPSISAVDYVLVAWAADANVRFYFDAGEDQGHRDDVAYNSWPNPATFIAEANTDKHSIYCTYTPEGPAIVEGSATGSGVGLASSSAKLDVLASALGNGIGLSQSSSYLIISGLASGEGIGLASATGQIVGIIVEGTCAGSGIGTATVQGILDILAEAGGSGVGLGSTEALIRVLAVAAASGEGLGSAEALLEIIAEALGSGEGLGIVIIEIPIFSSESGIGIERASRAGWLMKPAVYTKEPFELKTYTGE